MKGEVSDVPDDDVEMFYLPVAAIGFYDDPFRSVGDDGSDIETLKAEVVRDGGIRQPLAVAMSAANIESLGDEKVYAFNGNHRLEVARQLGFEEVLCENCWEDDAVPLTRARIEELGGRIVDEARPGPGSPRA